MMLGYGSVMHSLERKKKGFWINETSQNPQRASHSLQSSASFMALPPQLGLSHFYLGLGFKHCHILACSAATQCRWELLAGFGGTSLIQTNRKGEFLLNESFSWNQIRKISRFFLYFNISFWVSPLNDLKDFLASPSPQDMLIYIPM